MEKREQGKLKPAPQVPLIPDPKVEIKVRLLFSQYSNARKAAADRGQTFNSWICGVITEAVKQS